MLRIGIALHKINDCDYHWCLVIHPESYSAALVRTYELVNGNDLRFCRQSLSPSATLVGVIHVGQVDVSEHHMNEFLGGFGPERDDYPTGGRGWSSAGWVTRSLRYLDMSEMLRLRMTDEELYVRVTKLGAVIEEMKSKGHWGAPVSIVHL
ncbi:hypothetical protein JAAARDRAFT_47806 [Jaapia argillacea MUCL 33604]|uniref:Uncharacterized protein n=1 Tax=Jaapia argillacea MUCL 33604 TaxID=933084 RepID=A0A067Q3K2_9AGAM|nr:hypothetical protein JAAARDRAFT_47806 [Jaapia argillacea MUCL 33604]